MEMEAYTKVMWKGSKRCRNGVTAKVMVSPFVRTTQKKCPHKATTSVLSSFVMCVSGSHIKQQTSPGPVALSMFDRLGHFRLKMSENTRLAYISVCFDPLSTEALSAFTNLTWWCCCFFWPIHMFWFQCASELKQANWTHRIKSKHVNSLRHTPLHKKDSWWIFTNLYTRSR